MDYAVMALEGLWWTEDGTFSIDPTQPWLWTTMMLQPDHITQAMFEEGRHQLKKKKDNPAIDQLRLERFHEGLSIQIMHLGPYADEPRTLERLQSFAQENDLRYRGKHHEIYLGDPRRAKPEKLRTVLRQPVERIS